MASAAPRQVVHSRTESVKWQRAQAQLEALHLAGVAREDLYTHVTARRVARKREALANRCGICWHDKRQCICWRLEELRVETALPIKARRMESNPPLLPRCPPQGPPQGPLQAPDLFTRRPPNPPLHTLASPRSQPPPRPPAPPVLTPPRP